MFRNINQLFGGKTPKKPKWGVSRSEISGRSMTTVFVRSERMAHQTAAELFPEAQELFDKFVASDTVKRLSATRQQLADIVAKMGTDGEALATVEERLRGEIGKASLEEISAIKLERDLLTRNIANAESLATALQVSLVEQYDAAESEFFRFANATKDEVRLALCSRRDALFEKLMVIAGQMFDELYRLHVQIVGLSRMSTVFNTPHLEKALGPRPDRTRLPPEEQKRIGPAPIPGVKGFY
jgi:hypothetical protein